MEREERILSGWLESLIGCQLFARPCALTSSSKLLNCNSVWLPKRTSVCIGLEFLWEALTICIFLDRSALGNYPVPWHHGNWLCQFFLSSCAITLGLPGILLARQCKPHGDAREQRSLHLYSAWNEQSGFSPASLHLRTCLGLHSNKLQRLAPAPWVRWPPFVGAHNILKLMQLFLGCEPEKTRWAWKCLFCCLRGKGLYSNGYAVYECTVYIYNAQ